jgi:hypothetical protein
MTDQEQELITAYEKLAEAAQRLLRGQATWAEVDALHIAKDAILHG